MAKKKVNFELVEQGHEAYAVLEAMLANHPHLSEANIVLAWKKGYKPDKDGRLTLGKCKKASDLDKELKEHDFVILLNQEAWEDTLDGKQKNALVDHELCHAGVTTEKDGVTPKRDDRGRIVYRIVKHTIEEFHVIVARHGCYKSDIETFVKAAQTGKVESDLLFKDEVRQLLKSNNVEFEENVLPISDAM